MAVEYPAGFRSHRRAPQWPRLPYLRSELLGALCLGSTVPSWERYQWDHFFAQSFHPCSRCLKVACERRFSNTLQQNA